MEESSSESFKGSSSSGNISDSEAKRVKIRFVDTYVHSVEFAKTKDDIDKRYPVSEKDKIGILNQQGQTLETAQEDELVARHIISKRALINYWEHHLSKMTLDRAEKLVNERVSQLLKERKKIYPTGNLKLDTSYASTLKKRQDRLARNIDLLIGLELTASNNIFYGPSAANESAGGKLGSDRKQNNRSSNIEKVDYATKAESTLDLAKDKKTLEYFEKNAVKVDVVNNKIEDGKKRDIELGITKLFLNFIHGHKDRKERYPSDLSEANTEGRSRPNSPEHEVNYNNYKDAYENSSLNNAFGEHITQSLQMPPKDLDNKGNNIIHYAVHNKNADALLILLIQTKKENMLNQTNREGLTPLDIAIQNKDETMIKHLKDYGAKDAKSLELEKNEAEIEMLDTSVELEKRDDIPKIYIPPMASAENKIGPLKYSPPTPTLRMSLTTPMSPKKPESILKSEVDPTYVKPNVASFFSPRKPSLSLKSSPKVAPSTTDPFLSSKKTESPSLHSNSVIDLTGPEKKSTEDKPKKRFNLSLSKPATNENNSKEEGESPNKKIKTDFKKPENSTHFTYTPNPYGFGNK